MTQKRASAPKKEPKTRTHVDDFVSTHFLKDTYARWMLMHFRLPVALAIDFIPYLEGKRLFCDYQGKRYRVTGASRLGDIWLHSDFTEDTRYEHRVDLDECSNWGPAP